MNIGADILTVKSTKGVLSGKMMFSVASFVFGMVLFFTFIVPEYRDMKLLILEEKLRGSNLDEKNQTLAKMMSFERRVDNVSDSDIEKIKMLIPAEDKIELQLSNLDMLARVMNVKLSDLSITKSDSDSKNGKNQAEKTFTLGGKEVGVVDYSFKISGKYADILTFISSIERNVPLYNVNKVDLDVEKETKVAEENALPVVEEKTINANLSMKSYNY